MPVFKSGKGLAPAWCELEYFDIIELSPGEKHVFERMANKRHNPNPRGSDSQKFLT